MHFYALQSRKFWGGRGNSSVFKRKTGGGESTKKKDFFKFSHIHVYTHDAWCVYLYVYRYVHMHVYTYT